MAWCRQATSHGLNQCWPRSMSPNAITRSQWVNCGIYIAGSITWWIKILTNHINIQHFGVLHTDSGISKIPCHQFCNPKLLHTIPVMRYDWFGYASSYVLVLLEFLMQGPQNHAAAATDLRRRKLPIFCTVLMDFIGELRLGSDYHMNDTNTLNPICGIATVLPPGLLHVLGHFSLLNWSMSL